MDNTDNNNIMIEALSIRTYNRFIGYKIGFIAYLCSVTSANWPVNSIT
jgi:hypothetical protein